MILLGAEPVTGTPEELGELVKRELERNGKIIKDAGLRTECDAAAALQEALAAITTCVRLSALAAGGTATRQGPQRFVHLPLGAREIERLVYDPSNSPYRP